MSSSKLRAAILIVSESATRDPSTDKGIPALQEVFARIAADRWDVSQTKIVPDERQAIVNAVTSWTDDGDDYINLVLTSGGTGFTQKDITPEVSNDFCHARHPLWSVVQTRA